MPRPTTNTEYGKRVLEIDLDGRDVWELQIKLLGWGSGTENDGIGALMDPVRVNGKFDATTRDAVRRFQKAHKIPVTGIVDARTFRTIDGEVSDHPVLLRDLRCPCASKTDDPPILCRCKDPHTEKGKCTGFGKKKNAGKHLLDSHDTLSGETLDLYDMEEHDGVDKAVIWALRALMHRAKLDRIEVVAGYRCWHDNFLNPDDVRWHHRKGTLHFGKTIDFTVPGTCTFVKDTACAKCEAVRAAAVELCGYQLRWHEPDRITVAEVGKDVPEPGGPHLVHLDSVRRLGREADDFVKTDEDAAKPVYEDKLAAVSLPVDLGSGLDPRRVSSGDYFKQAETGAGGWFPLGRSRLFHGGIHLPGAAGDSLFALADGEVVGFRVGQADAQKLGSRNFVLMKHKWKTKDFYSLFMHLAAEPETDRDKIPWLKRVLVLRTANVEALEPSPIWLHVDGKKLIAGKGLRKGERAEITSTTEIAANTLDATHPADSKVVKLKSPADSYVFVKWKEGTSPAKEVAKSSAADVDIRSKIDGGEVVGLKTPVKVYAGELIGHVGPAPTDDSLKDAGTFVHLETFAGEQLLTGDGYVKVTAPTGAKLTDRKEVLATLQTAKLFVSHEGMIREHELVAASRDPARGRLRSVVLEMPSAWSTDWKTALSGSKKTWFLEDGARDALGDAFNEYRFWSTVKGAKDTNLPGSETVFHHHPIALVIQMAYEPPA